jgi:hypothetical protein
LPTVAAGPPPGHGWPRTRARCWLMVSGAHGSSHSAEVGRPCCSRRAAQCSAQCTWDLVVRLALPAKRVPVAKPVPTLDAVANTSTSRSGRGYVRARTAHVALPFLGGSVRHGLFSDGRTERRIFDALEQTGGGKQCARMDSCY